MTDTKTLAKIAELQARVATTQVDITAYIILEGSEFDMEIVSEAINEIKAYADQLQRIAEGE